MDDKGKELYDILMEKPLLELRKIYASGIYGDARGVDNRKVNKLKLVIAEKEREDEKNKFERIVGVSKNNANATKKLVIATWGLVIATALLVWITYIK